MKRLVLGYLPQHIVVALFFLCFQLTGFLEGVSNAFAEDYVGVFYVSITGDDNNLGTEDSPFASLERARDAIRSERQKGKNGKYCVRLKQGMYSRVAPFELTSLDSHTCYIGDDEGRSVISAGRKLEGWKIATDKQKENFPNNTAEIWRAELPVIDGMPLFFEHLFIGERRSVRARFPNKGFLRPKSVWEEFSMNAQTRRSDVSFTAQEIVAKEGDLDELCLSNIPVEELRFSHFVIHHHWDTTRRIILGYDSQKNALQAQGAPMKSWNPWRDTSLYYLENLRTAFDSPGEWFYAGIEGCVYYRPFPDEKIDSVEFIVPNAGVNQLLTISGNSNESTVNAKKPQDISFENICFSYTDAPRRTSVMKEANLPFNVTGDLSKPGPTQFEPAQSAFFTVATISVENAENIFINNCEISHVGEYGLWFKNCCDCGTVNTNFIDLGAGAIRIGGGVLDQRNKVENCVISQGGRFFAAATGVWIGQNTEEIDIIHNDINDFYYTGVSVGWVWGYKGGHAFRNRIEFNRIWKIGQGFMSDMGGVYTLGTSTGTRVCNNVIFDVSSYAYGGWGLYPDEGSEGILFENNLVYDTTDGSFHQHYGKDNIVRNNILARSKSNPAHAGEPPHQIAITRVEEHLSDTFERNIIYWKEGIALGYNADRAHAIYSNNLWYNAGGEATFSGKTHEQWVKETGKDVDGIVADPLFVDPDANDFRLQPNSPASKIGFIPFDYSQAGVKR